MATGLIVDQLQGHAVVRTLGGCLRWERFLVSALIAFAKDAKEYEEVQMRSAVDTAWFTEPMGLHLVRNADGTWGHVLDDGRTLAVYQTDLKRRYDGTARSLHFKWSEDKNAWVYPLRSG